MELSISTTRARIYEANEEFLNVLDVFRVINLPSPRSWQATIEFDATGKNFLHLGSSPALSDHEIQQLLDGRVPSLYAFKGFAFQFAGKVLTVDLDAGTWSGERETFLPCHENPTERIAGQLKVVGYVLPPSIANRESFLEWLHANTWFGSQKYRGKNYTFTVNYLGLRTTFGTLAQAATPSVPIFEHTTPLNVNEQFVGHLHLKFQPEGPRTIRHLKFGALNPETILPQFWKKMHVGDSGAELEVEEQHLSWFSSIGSLDLNYLRHLLASILAKKADIEKEAEYIDFQSAIIRYDAQLAAKKLLLRQQRLQRSPKIVCKSEEIMAVPSCENELVALYMKLECLGMLPFPCRVLEYTSRAGIDALATHQLSSTGAYAICAPVEFEFLLENYFDHEHPLDQTTLIVCWDIDEDACNNRWRKTSDPWLCFAIGTNMDIPVLLLSKIPGLTIATNNHI